MGTLANSEDLNKMWHNAAFQQGLHCLQINTKLLGITTCDLSLYRPRQEKTCLRGFVNNKGAGQPVHLHSLISAFNILLLESTISRLPTNGISSF